MLCLLGVSRDFLAKLWLFQLAIQFWISSSNCDSYLGILIDSTLSWSLHITSVVSRVRSRISSMLRFGTLPPTVLYLLYSTFVLPLFDYYDVVWTPTNAKLTGMLERVHSNFVNRLTPSFHAKFFYILTERRRFHKAIQVFKYLHFISPSYLHKIFL